METEYNCPLLNMFIDETICYDIQMVSGGMINKRILLDYEGILDIKKVTTIRVKECCETCPFNQMRQYGKQRAMA